jgi:hypothetical protein
MTILYYSLDIDKHCYNKLLNIVNKYELFDNYNINDKFHITMLFINKFNIKFASVLDTFVDSTMQVVVNSYAISDDFITFGVESIKYKDCDVPYFGNDIKHITCGISKNKKLFPKDSPNAFINGVIYNIEPIIINGKLIAIKRNMK